MYDQLILPSANNANAAGQRCWLIILLTVLTPHSCLRMRNSISAIENKHKPITRLIDIAIRGADAGTTIIRSI
jgi:hypothetical protein